LTLFGRDVREFVIIATATFVGTLAATIFVR
jgi:hypothetical protein